MSKRLAAIFALLACLCLCAVATGEIYVMDEICASVDIPSTFPIVLRPSYLDSFASWLESNGKDRDEVSRDMSARGVLLQCWNEEGDLCLEITAVQDDSIGLIFDVNEQSTEVRQSYRLGHYPRNEREGYEFTSAEWKNTDEGRFLVLPYKRKDMGETLYRGNMRRTIRNGFEVTLDMQVHGRSATGKDNTALNKIWDTFHFEQILPMSATASAQINITQEPPEETNQASFSLEGTAAPGVKLTGVVMGLNYPTPIVNEVTVGSNGKFKMDVTLPKQGVYLMTVTGENQGEDVVELAYPVTYSSTLLPVNIQGTVPTVLENDTLTIAGTTEPYADIQVFLNAEPLQTKRASSKGAFSLKFELEEEGQYEITLIVSRKNLADRRITYSVTRKWSEEDMLNQFKKTAVKPGYSTLISKMEGYEGRVMGYKAYFISASESGGEWMIQMALTRKKGVYSDLILVTSKEEPELTEGQRVMMYGSCAGMTVSIGDGENGEQEDETTSYPCFELLMFSEIEE